MKAVILAGGTGTRLWPLSRIDKPKQFQKLVGNRTMLQETIGRLNFLKPEDIYLSTNKTYEKIVREQTKKLINPKNIIIEPDLRDTAPCIGLAAVTLAKKYPHEVMAIIYADHLIQNKKEFIQKLKVAEKLARTENTLNIIEVKAKFPNVNLGYVKIGKMLKELDGNEIFSFEKFTEKPDLELAKKFLQSYKYLWNTGLYVWKISTILKYFKKYLPKTYKNLTEIQKNLGTIHEQETLQKKYPLCDKISIDYGIMEKVHPKEVRIIPAELGWSDVGTWESLFQELATNERMNITKGQHLSINTHGSLIYPYNHKLVATIGLKDIVIIDTEDALLVCKKDKSQEVKNLVEKMKNRKKFKKLL